MNRTAFTGVKFGTKSARSRRRVQLHKAAIEALESRRYLAGENPFDLIVTKTGGTFEGDTVNFELDWVNAPALPSAFHIDAGTWSSGFEEGIDFNYNGTVANAVAYGVPDNGQLITISYFDGLDDNWWYWDPSLANVSPTAAISSNISTAITGQTVTFSIESQYDPSVTDTAAGFVYAYDFDNDNNYTDPGETDSSASALRTFVFDSPGTKVIHGHITDKDSGYNDFYTTVTISDVAATFTNDGPVSEDSTVTVKFGDAFSRDGNESFTYSFDWDNNGSFEVSGSSSPTASTTFSSSGSKVIRGRVADAHSNTRDYFTTVTVTNTAPATPTGLKATPLSHYRIDLAWENSSTADGYEIDYSQNGFSSYDTFDTGARVNKATLDLTGSYSFRIRAYNSSGESSNSSTVNQASLGFQSSWEKRSTSLVKDLRAAPSSSPTNFVDLNGILFFTADDGIHGVELWKSNGTSAGTQLVSDINSSGSASSSPSNLTAVGNTLYFTADNGSSGRELWKYTNGGGVQLVSDIRSGSPSSNPSSLVAVANTLFFAADDGASGVELWRSDSAGTSMVLNINGSGGSAPTELTNANGTLYFAAASDGTNAKLWKSGGASTNTAMVVDKDGGNVSSPEQLTSNGGTLFFSAVNGSGREPWVSNGTSSGTFMLKDIHSGSESSDPSDLTIHNGRLFFVAGNSTDAGSGRNYNREVYRSDGTTAGTGLFKDLLYYLFSGTETENPLSSYPSNLASVGGALVLTAGNIESWREMWISDGEHSSTNYPSPVTGTVNGPGRVNINTSPVYREFVTGGELGSRATNFVQAGPSTYFVANDLQHGFELFQIATGFDLNQLIPADVPRMLKDIMPGSGGSMGANETDASNCEIGVAGGLVYFVADDGAHGFELWRTNGTAAGTILVKDINSGNPGSSQGDSVEYLGSVYFAADDGSGKGVELWKSDGTSEGTSLVRDILTGAGSSNPTNLCVFDGHLFFAADDGANGAELWRSDGTSSGTAPFMHIRSGSGSSNPGEFQTWGASLFFSADDGTNGVELWKSNGTSAGTSMVRNIRSGSASSSPTDLTIFDGWLYFAADDGTSGRELWRTDGTSAGTSLFKDIKSGAGSSSPQYIVGFMSNIYFAADDGTYGTELWVSNGSTAGTSMLLDIRSGAASSSPSYLTVAGASDTLFFAANDGTHGVELWASDGSAYYTGRLKDINPSSASSSPANLTAVGARLYFTASDGNGNELWASDGTSVGTAPVSDINPGSGSSNPANLMQVSDKLFFSADDGQHGQELWLASGFALGASRDGSNDPGYQVRFFTPTDLDGDNATFISESLNGTTLQWTQTWHAMVTGQNAATIVVKFENDIDSARGYSISVTLTGTATISSIALELPKIAAFPNTDYRTLSALRGGTELPWVTEGLTSQSSGWWMDGGVGNLAYSSLAAFYDSNTGDGVGLTAFNTAMDPMQINWVTSVNGVTPTVIIRPKMAVGTARTYDIVEYVGADMPAAHSTYYRDHFLAPMMDDLEIAEAVYDRKGQVWGLQAANDANDPLKTSDEWAYVLTGDSPWGSDPTFADLGADGFVTWTSYTIKPGYAFESYSLDFDWEDDFSDALSALGMGNQNLGVLIRPYWKVIHDENNHVTNEAILWNDLRDPVVQDELAAQRDHLAANGLTVIYFDQGGAPDREHGTVESWIELLRSWEAAGIHIGPEEGGDVAAWITGANMHFPGGVATDSQFLWRGGNSAVSDIVTPDATQFIFGGNSGGIRAVVNDVMTYWWDVALEQNMTPILDYNEFRRHVAPGVVSVAVNTASNPDEITVVFDQIVSSLDTADLVIEYLNDSTKSVTHTYLDFNSGTKTARFRIDSNSGVLESGLYRVTVEGYGMTGNHGMSLGDWGDDYVFYFEI